MRRLLDTDPLTGISHVFYKDEGTSQYSIVAEQDVSPIIDACKRDFNAAPARFGEWSHVGRIPYAVLADWRKDGRDRDQKFLKRWLNDSAHLYFRTHPGKI
jgi:hypothetical protein